MLFFGTLIAPADGVNSPSIDSSVQYCDFSNYRFGSVLTFNGHNIKVWGCNFSDAGAAKDDHRSDGRCITCMYYNMREDKGNGSTSMNVLNAMRKIYIKDNTFHVGSRTCVLY